MSRTDSGPDIRTGPLRLSGIPKSTRPYPSFSPLDTQMPSPPIRRNVQLDKLIDALIVAQLAVLDLPGVEFEDKPIALACQDRWATRFDIHESVPNRIIVAVIEAGTKLMMNPRPRYFSRVRANEFVLLDAAAKTMARPVAPDPTAWSLHGSIHKCERLLRFTFSRRMHQCPPALRP